MTVKQLLDFSEDQVRHQHAKAHGRGHPGTGYQARS